MTTIRRTRLAGPDGVPAGTEPADDRAAAPAGPPGAPLRIALLDAVPGERTTLDGAWWPRSRSLADELPALVTRLQQLGVRVSRVTYNVQSWEDAPRRLDADGRVIRLGWFRGLDPQLVNLSGGDDGRDRLDLLVVPPDTEEAVARRAMSAACTRRNDREPTAVLAALAEDRAS